MTIFLLFCAVVILLCVFLNKVSSKVGVPMLLFFIALGLFFGSDGALKIPFENYAFAEQICSVALIFIMFYGGFGTSWRQARPVAGKAALLSTVGVAGTAGLTGLFCHFTLGMAWLQSLLVGAVLSSTDAASVFSILRGKRLGLKDHTASLLEMESGSNDPCSYMLTMVVLALMQGNAQAGGVLYLMVAQIVYGGLIGVALAAAALFILKRFRFATGGFDAIFVLAVAVLSYALPTLVGGNGYLSAYLVGLGLGNARIPNKKGLVAFFDGLTGLMQMLIFFLLGLLAFPSQLPSVLLSSVALALFLTFVARPAVVFLLLRPFGCKVDQCLLVSWAGLRGAASIVFAIMATIHPASTQQALFHIVFCVVMLSIAFQGTLIPWVAGKLGMLSAEENVMKTFTDYAEEEQVRFVELHVTEKHPWIGKRIEQIELPPGLLLVMILRGQQTLLPRGQTRLCQNDIAVLGAPSYEGRGKPVELTETTLEPGDERIGRPVSSLEGPRVFLVLIKRKGQCILPNGRTVLRLADTLVLYTSDAL